MTRPPLSALESRLGHTFTDQDLLRQALTHPSATQELGLVGDYQRLEFLGDAIVGFTVAAELFRRYPEAAEGSLSKLKAELVSGRSLAAVAKSEGFGAHMILGRGEEQTRGRQKTSLLADIFEAIIGAVYLDAGIPKAQTLVLRLLTERIAATRGHGGAWDYKSKLQVRTQASHQARPVYAIVDHIGPEHEATFVAEVRLGETLLGRGEGRTKKAAEQAAAEAALQMLDAR